MIALRSPEFAPTTVNYAALTPLLPDLTRFTTESTDPFDAHMVMIRAIYLAAKREGMNIVLDGIGGDILLSSDFHLAFHLREGRVRQTIRDARGERRFWGPTVSAWRIVLAAAWQAFAPTQLRAIRFWWGRRKADRDFLQRAKAVAPFLNPIRALNRRRHVQRRDFANDRIDALTRLRPLTDPNLVVGNERYDRVAAACGIEPRDPFLDLRLIRFCLSLPRDQVQRDGWTKWILRRVMERTVPVELAWRRGKDHIGPEFTRAVIDGRAPSRADRAKPLDESLLFERYENIYLSNWFAYMLRSGWTAGTVTRKVLKHDER